MAGKDILTARAAAVPFLDLVPIHQGLKPELLEAIGALIDAGTFVNGPAVAEFEEAFARYCGAPHCVGLASGLDALRLGLIAAGLEPGEEVVVPANTFIASVEAIEQAGGRPLLVDADELDYNVDVQAAAAALTTRTGFLLPVHLYGQLADMRALADLAERTGLRILEDACQAHGASRDGISAGTAGVAAAFSFYPGKNLGAMGDAGALVTADAALADTVRALREHGQRRKYHHDLAGYTARLDTIQALVLSRKLALLDEWNAQRRAAATYYSVHLEGLGDLRLPAVPEGSEPVWHLYVVRTAAPDRLAGFLRERGIGSGRHYPEPIHLTAAYAHLGHRPGSFPVAERLAGEVLSLPIFPGITEIQLDSVIDAVAAYFRG